MTVTTLTTPRVFIDGTDVAAHVSAVVVAVDVDVVDSTGLASASAGWKHGRPAEKSGSITIGFNQDFDVADSFLWNTVGRVVPVIAVPTNAGVSATNPAYSGHALVTSLTPIAGKVGDLATMNVTWPLSGELARTPYPLFTGGTEADSGEYRYHTFTSSGTLTCVIPGQVEYLVVGGGGGGGRGVNNNTRAGGGGGAGGARSGSVELLTTQAVTVGAGGAGGDDVNGEDGSNGSSSSLGAVTATGGGGGGTGTISDGGPGVAGASGGGGGAGGNTTGSGTTGGSGTVGQGSAGGAGFSSSAFANRASGGGGGAGSAGTAGTSGVAGSGGVGVEWPSGSGDYFAAGGDGALYNTTGTAGVDGTGDGGGGSGENNVGAAGGDGVVIVRYQIG